MKIAKINIKMYEDERLINSINFKLEKSIWGKGVDLIYKNKFEGRLPMSKILNKILKRLTEFFY